MEITLRDNLSIEARSALLLWLPLQVRVEQMVLAVFDEVTMPFVVKAYRASRPDLTAAGDARIGSLHGMTRISNTAAALVADLPGCRTPTYTRHLGDDFGRAGSRRENA